MRLRSAAGDLSPEDVGLELFDRSATAWLWLGAPAELYDVDAAAEAAAAAGVAPVGGALEGLPGEVFDQRMVRRLYAHRYWAWARPAFLASVGALTAEERFRLTRFPKFHVSQSSTLAQGLNDPATTTHQHQGEHLNDADRFTHVRRHRRSRRQAVGRPGPSQSR